MSLTPDYLNLDFATLKQKLKEELAADETFKDYNFEGSNLSVLLELVAWLGDISTFYTNKIAENLYIDTATVYENVHRLAQLVGYSPKGHLAAQTDITVTVSGGVSPGDQLYVEAWTQIDSTEEYDGDIIKFATTIPHTENIPSGATFPYDFDIPVRQGVVTEIDYTGDSIIDNELVLPLKNFAYDDDLDDDNVSIELSVESILWSRISNFYDEISALSTQNNVYKFVYNKYQQYAITFSNTRQVPIVTDNIIINLLETLGLNGAVGAHAITALPRIFVKNNTTGKYLVPTIINPTTEVLSDVSSTNTVATIVQSNPETIDEIKNSVKGELHSQHRNVTKIDYTSFLESRSDITKANVWGEQEIAPSGDPLEYNKAHISLIPYKWGSGTIITSASEWTTESLSGSVSGATIVPTSYESSYENAIAEYLEPRKMLCAYETYDLPELVYFAFDFGIRINRTYDLDEVIMAIKNKLIYYFDDTQRDFNETINFLDITEYIINLDEPPNSEWSVDNIKGIRNLILREIYCNMTIYETNAIGNYPQYLTSSYNNYVDNKLRPLKLGFNQFPQLSDNLCSIVLES